MSERDFIGRETNHFAPNALPVVMPGALLTRGAPAGEYSMPRGKWFVRVVLMQAQQPALAAAPDEYHRAARAFVLPAFALERGEAIGETLAQIAAGR